MAAAVDAIDRHPLDLGRRRACARDGGARVARGAGAADRVPIARRVRASRRRLWVVILGAAERVDIARAAAPVGANMAKSARRAGPSHRSQQLILSARRDGQHKSQQRQLRTRPNADKANCRQGQLPPSGLNYAAGICRLWRRCWSRSLGGELSGTFDGDCERTNDLVVDDLLLVFSVGSGRGEG